MWSTIINLALRFLGMFLDSKTDAKESNRRFLELLDAMQKEGLSSVASRKSFAEQLKRIREAAGTAPNPLPGEVTLPKELPLPGGLPVFDGPPAIVFPDTIKAGDPFEVRIVNDVGPSRVINSEDNLGKNYVCTVRWSDQAKCLRASAKLNTKGDRILTAEVGALKLSKMIKVT